MQITAQLIVRSTEASTPMLKNFGELINICYTIATAPDLPISDLDDVSAIPHYRQDLEADCILAAKLFNEMADDEAVICSTIKLQASLIELLGASPLAIKPCSLAIRANLLEISNNYLKA